jgi:hypothetical protein
MELLLDFPTIGEPHYAQSIPAELVKPREVKFFKIEENKHPSWPRVRRRPRSSARQGGACVDDHHPLALRTRTTSRV